MSDIIKETWQEEYDARHAAGVRFALTFKERFEVQQIIREELRAAYTEVFFGDGPDPSLKTTAEAVTTPTPSQVQDGNAEETVEDIMTRTRRRYWENRFEQGYHGHLAGNKEKWVNDQLDREGYL